ncbi:FAD-dependent oxidoreductase [Diaphorobacter sp. HDW4B]|uniref:FAD-dependent oxidoreductase n=1 Tax=Diaphorobacter sp. HDW4B TaxID=2714925 RepID=UPI001F0DE6BA|nr:FAD-dependent oxidoreductase [Diaphorobacter sp. HDW4B]
MSSAVTAAQRGLKVIVIEKEARFGGTTAWSGGWMWIPRNPLALAAGISEHEEDALNYLRLELGEHFEESRARTYLAQAPHMVEFFQRHTALRFIDGNAIPDFHGNNPHAVLGGRSVCAAPFDGRRLGQRVHTLKPPLQETTLWGMGIASGQELRHFLNSRRSLASFWYVSKRLLQHARDVLLHNRSLRLVNGNALVAALAASAFELDVDIRTSHAAVGLLRSSGRISGATVHTSNGPVVIHASQGVVLACGGFPHDAARKAQMLAHAREGHSHHSAAGWGNTGDGLRLGESVGGWVRSDLKDAAALAPVSLVPRADGSTGHFPHLIERAKPGLIAVRSDGKRFVNEADSYHDFMRGLLAATPEGETVQAWLLCDREFFNRFGLGAAKPWPMPKTHWLRSGYLVQADTWDALALACGIDQTQLKDTVSRYNAMALQGQDTEFAKGETAYNRVQGEVRPGLPNPCMAPLIRGPFYAVRVVAGSLGTFAGLSTDEHARVLDQDGEHIPGLYAVGNDMSSLMAGCYPSGGITLGPAMTFGFIAARHASEAVPV